MALRTRLTTINPERTILLRGTVRPGILVEEAEAIFAHVTVESLCHGKSQPAVISGCSRRMSPSRTCASARVCAS